MAEEKKQVAPSKKPEPPAKKPPENAPSSKPVPVAGKPIVLPAKSPAEEKREPPKRVAETITIYHRADLTLGQRLADKMTEYCGSWRFIVGMLWIIALWFALNSLAFLQHWDPYPFIFLNLFLSCLAALQAPIILMSQNRSTERDRTRAERDYHVNRKAEREVENMQSDLEEIKKMIHSLKK